MSRFLSSASVLSLLAACGDGGRLYTYSVDAEIVVPEDLARELAVPSLVEVEWMGEVHGLRLICEPLEGELRVDLSHSVETMGHASRQIFTARVVPWPDDVPCEEERIGTFLIASPHDVEVPYVHVYLFEDEVGFLGRREDERVESFTVEVGYED